MSKSSSRRPRIVPKGEGREAILAAVARVVAQRGLDAVTFRAVAAEAGVSAGLATYHFPDRETMILEALRWAVTRAMDATRPDAAGAEPSSFAAALSSIIDQAPYEALFQFELELQAFRRPDLRDEVRTLYRAYIEGVRASLESWGFGSNLPAARLVFAALDGLVLQQLIFDSPAETMESVKILQACLVVASERFGSATSGGGQSEGDGGLGTPDRAVAV